ncbi:hypothetical protein M768_03755 [Cellulosimicrobium cellulans F16]|uniref:Uncharacterized protein n=1 Tax=Cellulosimicrobium cellulans F16 TaxID=1350482 RepID=A0A0M0FCF8_CELCE|nr:hypothetical protein [Cellulosimicrobium cellulans]KON75067.1 hypothetical protein M768_03755 [Cellulosimicrobium cellulans F16]
MVEFVLHECLGLETFGADLAAASFGTLTAQCGTDRVVDLTA